MATIFLTGGTGFIGSHLAEALLARGHTVRALLRGNPRWLDAVPGVERVKGSLSDVGVLWEALQGVDYVYHVAGVTRATSDEVFEAGNVRATLNLLGAIAHAAPNVRKVLITSSLAAVGACSGGIASEDAPLNPISLYGASKARMEQALFAKHEMTASWAEQLPLVVVRPPAVYGPREADIFTFFKTVSQGICPVVGSAKTPVLSLVHSTDLVEGMIQAAEHPETSGKTYFIGSAEVYSWGQIRDATAKALGRRVLTIPIPESLVVPIGTAVEAVGRLFKSYPPLNREKAREIRDACKACSIERARADFGYAPRISLEDGIAETLRWYKQEKWL